MDCRLIAMELGMPKITEEIVSVSESAVAITADNVISSTPYGEKVKIRKCEDRSLLNCSKCNLAEACTIYLSK